MNNMNKIMIGVAVVVVGIGAFFGGTKYAQSKTQAAQQARIGQFSNRMGGMMRGGGMAGGGFTGGDIIAKDDKSITIKLRDGGSKIVFYSGTTQVGKMISGASTDLEIGKSVTVMGTTNTDGSITAQSVQIR